MVEAFANHCFGCSEWGYLMVECQHYISLSMEVPNEGFGRGFGMSDIVVVIDEGTLSKHVIKMPYFKIVAS